MFKNEPCHRIKVTSCFHPNLDSVDSIMIVAFVLRSIMENSFCQHISFRLLEIDNNETKKCEKSNALNGNNKSENTTFYGAFSKLRFDHLKDNLANFFSVRSNLLWLVLGVLDFKAMNSQVLAKHSTIKIFEMPLTIQKKILMVCFKKEMVA